MTFDEVKFLSRTFIFTRWSWNSARYRNTLQPPGIHWLYVPLEMPGYARASARIT